VSEIEAMRRFTAIYDTHHGQVYGYAVDRAGARWADEIVSETFLVAWRRFAEVPEPALPWLLGVARNLAREQFRLSARDQSIEADLSARFAAGESTSADPADVVTERDTVLTALAALSQDDRELLTLVLWHGVSPREAASVIGCSTPTYFVRLHRARRRLEHILKAQERAGNGRDQSRSDPPRSRPPQPDPLRIGSKPVSPLPRKDGPR
jgi:RNA polymerase sigma-70 factor, ECF subfamily